MKMALGLNRIRLLLLGAYYYYTKNKFGVKKLFDEAIVVVEDEAIIVVEDEAIVVAQSVNVRVYLGCIEFTVNVRVYL